MPCVSGGQPEAAGLVQPHLLPALPLHLPEEVERVPVQALEVDQRVEGGGEAGRVPGGARRQLALLQQDHGGAPGELLS